MQDKISSFKNFIYIIKHQLYPRVGHRTIQLGHHILVFGGTNSSNEYLSQILRINCEYMSVDSIITKTPFNLEGFSLFYFKSNIYIWAGFGPQGITNNLLKFTGEDFQIIKQNGQIPCPRFNHSFCFFSQKYLMIYGGRNEKQFLRDFYVLQCQTMIWNKITINSQLPYSINSKIFWNGGRGFFVLSELFNLKENKLMNENKVYEIRFTDFKQFKLQISQLSQSNSNLKPNTNKMDQSIIFVNSESPYLILLGGERISSPLNNYNIDQINNDSDIWIFNLETLDWTPGRLKLQIGFGFQTVLFQERLYLIGGICRNSKELYNSIEVVDINYDTIESKVCSTCREVYGLRQYLRGHSNFSVKFQYQQNKKKTFSSILINEFTKFIKNPFSAFSLLIDNAINMNATLIKIQFNYLQKLKSSQMNNWSIGAAIDNIGDKGLQIQYSYIKITDDTYGFTSNQILQCLYTFGIKTQKITNDKKFQSQLQIRKQYGINLKIGALRLGKSCLFVSKTQDQSIFVCYFSINQETVNHQFTILHYFLNQNNEVNSKSSRKIIKQKVDGFIPQDYQCLQDKNTTKIYIFNVCKQIKKTIVDVDNYNFYYTFGSSTISKNFKLYLQSFFLNSYAGKLIKLQNQIIKYRNYIQLFKKGQLQSNLQRLEIEEKQGQFKEICIYKCLNDKYPIKQILVYHQNRILYTFDAKPSQLCGVIVIPDEINVDLCKTKIQSHSQELMLKRFIISLLKKYKDHQKQEMIEE